MNKQPKSMKQIFNSRNSGLQELLDHALQLNILNEHLSRLLPSQLAPHCTAAGVERGTLLLLTDSPAWATRLRLQAPDLIRALQDFQIKSVEVQVKPAQKTPQPLHRSPSRMSKDTANLLNLLAEGVTAPKLRQSLQRLARHCRKEQ